MRDFACACVDSTARPLKGPSSARSGDRQGGQTPTLAAPEEKQGQSQAVATAGRRGPGSPGSLAQGAHRLLWPPAEGTHPPGPGLQALSGKIEEFLAWGAPGWGPAHLTALLPGRAEPLLWKGSAPAPQAWLKWWCLLWLRPWLFLPHYWPLGQSSRPRPSPRWAEEGLFPAKGKALPLCSSSLPPTSRLPHPNLIRPTASLPWTPGRVGLRLTSQGDALGGGWVSSTFSSGWSEPQCPSLWHDSQAVPPTPRAPGGQSGLKPDICCPVSPPPLPPPPSPVS